MPRPPLLLVACCVVLAPHFSLRELECRCGNCAPPVQNLERLAQHLEKARTTAGVPFRICSGYRCPPHNKAIGGTPNSAHTRGLAADIRTSSAVERHRILGALFIAATPRIGVYPTFAHADIDTTLPSTVCWLGGLKDL